MCQQIQLHKNAEKNKSAVYKHKTKSKIKLNEKISATKELKKVQNSN